MTNAFLTFFPQFCREPINDRAWYPGFTDWDLIRNVSPIRQRRFTPSSGFYDLGDPLDIGSQLNAVAKSPWPAIALYQYFFNGQFALDNVEQYILRTEADIPTFFVIWANETWSKRWIGEPQNIIIKQDHSLDPGIIKSHVDRLEQLFRHPRYFHENGRPVFVIYAPFEIQNVSNFIAAYRAEFERRKINPRIGFCVSYLASRFDASEFDFCVEFQPRLFFNVLRSQRAASATWAGTLMKEYAPEVFERVLAVRDRLRRKGGSPSIWFDYSDYLKLVQEDYFSKVISSKYDKPAYKALFYSWNNFPRYRGSATAVAHHKDDYAEFLRLSTLLSGTENWFLLNSWNEWSEGAALEPGLDPAESYELG